MKMPSPDIVQFDELRVGTGDEQRHHHAADRTEHAGDHERRQLGAEHVDAEEARALGVVADHAQRVAERGFDDLAQDQQPDHQQRDGEDVAMRFLRQVDAEEWRARDAAHQALVAAGQRHPGDDQAVEQHLEGERDEGEVDVLEPDADRADHEAAGSALVTIVMTNAIGIDVPSFCIDRPKA